MKFTFSLLLSLLLLLFLLLPFPSFAQAPIVATPTSSLALGITSCTGCPSMDVPTASAYAYKVYVDGATTGTPLTGIVCAGTTTITCTCPIPAFTAGNHTITVTAANPIESGKSLPVTFTMVRSAPGAPTIRFIQGP